MALDDQLPLSVLEQAYKRAYPYGRQSLADLGGGLDPYSLASGIAPIAPSSAAGYGAGMLPGAGIADILGLMPNFQGGYQPSFGQNIKAGQYGQAAAQTLGAAGDVMMALPAMAPIGALAKAARSTLAPAEEISRAAAQTAKEGITQPALRTLYDELGLTGAEPSVLAGKSLNQTQPQELIDRATELKLADRRFLNDLPAAARKIWEDKKRLPPGMMFPSKEANAAATAAQAPITAEVKKAEGIFDTSAARGQFKNTVLFDLSPQTLTKTPDVPQFNLPRVAPDITENISSAARGGMARLERAAAAAPRENWGWYNLMQLKDMFHQVHGPEQGEQAFNAWLDGLAGTSMVNPIDNNVKSSSWYLQQILQGKPLPQVMQLQDPQTGKTVSYMAGGPPPGYGAKSQIQHADRVREYLSNTYDPVENPKPISYRMNLGGNWMPRTVDTHDIRNAIGMPLAQKIFSESEANLLPKEYAYLEQLGGRAAQRAGMPQAAQQAATWIGGGQYTGLKSFPAPLLAVMNRRAHVTAMVRGQQPHEALLDFISGRQPLL